MIRYKPMFNEDSVIIKKSDIKSVDSDKWNVIHDVVKEAVDFLNTHPDVVGDFSAMSQDAFVDFISDYMRINEKEPEGGYEWRGDVAKMYQAMKDPTVSI